MATIEMFVDDPDDAPTFEEIIAKVEKDGIKNVTKGLIYIKVSAEYFNKEGVDKETSCHFGAYLVLSRPLENIEKRAVESISQAALRTIINTIPNPLSLIMAAIDAELIIKRDRERG